MSQTTVAEQGLGNEGQLYDLGNTDIVSHLAEGGSIKFGKFVVLGSASNQAQLPAAAADITDFKKRLGVALRELTVENSRTSLGSGAAEYPEKRAMSVLKKGRVIVKMLTAFDESSDVFVGFQNGEEGDFSSAASADRAQLDGVRVLNSGQAGELAILDLSLV